MAHRRRQLLSSSSEFLKSPPSLGHGYELLHPPTQGLIQDLGTTFPYSTVLKKTRQHSAFQRLNPRQFLSGLRIWDEIDHHRCGGLVRVISPAMEYTG